MLKCAKDQLLINSEEFDLDGIRKDNHSYFISKIKSINFDKKIKYYKLQN